MCGGDGGGRTSAIARIFHTGLCSCSYQGVFFRKTVSFSENSAYVLNERAQTKNIHALRNNLVKLNYTLSMALSRQLQSSLHGISALITIILVPIVYTFMQHRSKESLLINLNFEKNFPWSLGGGHHFHFILLESSSKNKENIDVSEPSNYSFCRTLFMWPKRFI